MYTWDTITVFILFFIIFIIAISFNIKESRCPKEGAVCFDGNGKYQYKGRGHTNESVETLLQRIKWSAKNTQNRLLYSVSYIISFIVLLAVIIILYGYSYYCMVVSELVVLLLAIFIVVFSVFNLFDFHTDRYPQYYIIKNVLRIQKKLGLDNKDPPKPNKKSYVPNRTKIREIFNR